MDKRTQATLPRSHNRWARSRLQTATGAGGLSFMLFRALCQASGLPRKGV